MKLNVIIPMAGRGVRFLNEGFNLPKPLIPVGSKTMIERVIDNLNINNAQYIFIIKKEHDITFNLSYKLTEIVPNCTIIKANSITEGPACTALLAKDVVDESNLIVVNCDQVIGDFNLNTLLEFSKLNKADGVLGAFISSSQKNSYMKLDPQGNVLEIKEKLVISNIATNGVHFWNNGMDFIESIEFMIKNNERYNDEFYIAPSYNYLITKGKKILPFFYNLHMPIGTPDDLKNYMNIYGII